MLELSKENSSSRPKFTISSLWRFKKFNWCASAFWHSLWPKVCGSLLTQIVKSKGCNLLSMILIIQLVSWVNFDINLHAVAFIVGMVLFAFLPWILEIVNRRLKEKNEAKLGILKSPVIQGIAKSALKNASYLWPFSIVATVSGRVCGDVHWVTDTLAGACLGASLVSIFLFISTAIDRQKLQN